MSRQMDFEHDAEGSNSFLDVITASIGILIILVMITGAHSKQVVEALVTDADNKALASAQAEEASIDQHARQLAAQVAGVNAELAARQSQRDRMSTLVVAIERDLEDRRATLDEQAQASYDAERERALAQDELKRLQAQARDAEKAQQPKTVEIESYPTPISKTVDTKEVHFQLSNGRVAFVPYEPLVDRLRYSLRDYVSRMGDSGELVDTIGPVEGFRLRFVIQRTDSPHGSLFQLAYAEFVPVTGRLGEPVEQALQPGSKFRETLEMMAPQNYTVTIWTYPDSFTEFRKIKKELYKLGYAVAARPLPEGMPIGASPQGSKSSAE